MSLRYSDGIRNRGFAGSLGFRGAFNRGYIEVYSAAQGASANDAKGGTLLGVITKSGSALTKETRATATLQVTGGAGTLTYVKAGTLPIIDQAAEIVWATSNAATAAVICAAINRCGLAEATVSGDTITVKPRPGFGDTWNTLALSAAGITCTGSNFAGGVDPANALVLDEPAAGVISKPAADEWKFTGLAVGVATSFRFYPSDTADSGADDSAGDFCRMDGSCGVGAGDCRLSSVNVTVGSVHTVQAFAYTIPAA